MTLDQTTSRTGTEEVMPHAPLSPPLGSDDLASTGLRDVLSKAGKWASRPEFFLVYLLFYFTPWLFRAPTMADMVVAIVAVLVFLPIHFKMFNKSTADYIPLIGATALIGFAAAPFWGAPGVFHIYATTQAGFQRPSRRALSLIVGLTILYIPVSVLLGRAWIEIAFVVFMGLVTGISCISGADQIATIQLAEETRALEREQAAISERERIARDLHDLLGHTLTMVALKSDIASRVMEDDPARARQEIEEIRDSARTALRDVRAVVADMTVTTITEEVHRAARVLKAANVDLTVRGQAPQVGRSASTMIGLAIREAVTNIVRHAKAGSAHIEFTDAHEQLHMTVRDDGHVQADVKPGAGLKGLVRRIESLGGCVEFSSQDGFVIKFLIPISHRLYHDDDQAGLLS